MSTQQNCRLCKQDLELDQFLKNGKTLKTCETCRNIVREAKKQKKEDKNADSENSGSDTEKATKLDFQETPVPEPTPEPKPAPEPAPEEIPTPANSPSDEPVEAPKLKRAPRKTKEKNLPSTKRVRKVKAKTE